MFQIFSKEEKDFLSTIDSLNVVAELYCRRLVSPGIDEDSRVIMKGIFWMFFYCIVQLFLIINVCNVVFNQLIPIAENYKFFALVVSILMSEYLVFTVYVTRDKTSVWETIEYFIIVCAIPATLYLATRVWYLL